MKDLLTVEAWHGTHNESSGLCFTGFVKDAVVLYSRSYDGVLTFY